VVASSRKRASAGASRFVSIPFIAGQWSLLSGRPPSPSGAAGSQSPSLRGSGRFESLRKYDHKDVACLNPLHCGAVVASGRRQGARGSPPKVSIPFIAGQWSLHRASDRAAPSRPVSIPFIAGQWSLRREASRGAGLSRRVSIPFIAGQWSLREIADRIRQELGKSQSPSLRGSGRFSNWRSHGRRKPKVSIPFIAGQWSLPFLLARLTRFDLCASQSPSLRGSGRFDGAPPSPEGGRAMSQSPSLRGSGRFIPVPDWWTWDDDGSQSPSLRGSGRFLRTRRTAPDAGAGLNPLHCGAVVASIAQRVDEPTLVNASQSPSLRGSGRFIITSSHRSLAARRLNPLHCGAVVASTERLPPEGGRTASQSPSLRGSGRFPHPPKAGGGIR